LAEVATDKIAPPRLLPLTLALSVFFWIVATTGGRQVFVKEVLSEAYDSQAEHLLRGDPGVDVAAIRHEAIIVNGKVFMYFGPFPAFLRIPLNFIYPGGRGTWSRISGFCAAVIALFAFAGLISQALRCSALSARWRNWLGNACLAGFALASPLLFLLGNLSIYNEAVTWGFAWSLAALFFAYRSRNAEGLQITCSLLGFSVCAAAALLSRVTFGVPLLLIAPLLALGLPCTNRVTRLTALVLPLGAGLAFYLLLSYAKFGTLTGTSYESYINPVHREFAEKNGIFNLRRVAAGFADYFSLRLPALQNRAPFLRADRHLIPRSSLYSLPFSETYLPVTWCSSWLVLGGILGIARLLQPKSSTAFERAAALAFFSQLICILSFHALAERYTAELYPFLILGLLVFLRLSGATALYTRYAVIGLVGLSIVVNSLTTASWLADVDQNVQPETRAVWRAILGRNSPAVGEEHP
jgi:hypothetical protein